METEEVKEKKEKKEKQVKEKSKEEIKKQSLNKLYIANVIIAIAFEIIMVFMKKSFSGINVARIITAWGFFTFLGLHYVLGAPTLYDKIVKKRFLISGIMIVITTILGYFMNPLSVTEWLKSTDVPLSLVWNIEFYGLLLTSFELFKIITGNKQGMSIVATITLTFSTLVQVHFSVISMPLISIQLIVILIDKVMTATKNKNKIIAMVGCAVLGILSIFQAVDYMIPFAYIAIGLIIWLIIKNKENLKDKNTLIFTIITLVITLIVPLIYRLNFYDKKIYFTDYNGIENLFYYLNNYMIPYSEINNAFEVASIYSLFPIPLLIGLFYLYKKEGHTTFLLPVILVTVFEILMCANVFNYDIKNVFGFNEAKMYNVSAAISLANLYMMFYILGNITDMKFETKHAIRFSLIMMCLLIFINRPSLYADKSFLFYNAAELCAMMFLFLFWTEKKYRNTFLGFLVVITMIGGITINPLLTEHTEIVKPKEEVIYYN